MIEHKPTGTGGRTDSRNYNVIRKCNSSDDKNVSVVAITNTNMFVLMVKDKRFQIYQKSFVL